MKLFKVLFVYRGFILGNVKREFQSKYRNSLLGALWNVLNPLAMIFVYTILFSQVMKAKLPGVDNSFAYSIYLCAGVLSWGLFAEILSRGQTLFLDYANLIKKINFPRFCLPVTVVANALVNFAIIFSVFTLFLIVSGLFPGVVILGLIPVTALMVAFAISLGVTLGVLNVFFRDVGHFVGIFLQFWFWLTPIVYPMSILPNGIQAWMWLNPMVGLVQSFQQVLVVGAWPNWQDLLPMLVLTIIFAMLGMRLFHKHSGEIVDEI